MRTTITLDPDVERLLRDEMHRKRLSFKESLNQAIRRGFSSTISQSPEKPFIVCPQPMGLRAGIDPLGFNRLADDLETEAIQDRNSRLLEESTS